VGQFSDPGKGVGIIVTADYFEYEVSRLNMRTTVFKILPFPVRQAFNIALGLTKAHEYTTDGRLLDAK
jgi:hypothetical protein